MALTAPKSQVGVQVYKRQCFGYCERLHVIYVRMLIRLWCLLFGMATLVSRSHLAGCSVSILGRCAWVLQPFPGCHDLCNSDWKADSMLWLLSISRKGPARAMEQRSSFRFPFPYQSYNRSRSLQVITPAYFHCWFFRFGINRLALVLLVFLVW